MEIKTKYNVGDEVWIMRDNKPTKIEISNITVEVVGLTMQGSVFLTGKYNTRIYYTEIQRKGYRNSMDKDPEYSYTEAECYPTKRALLESFMGKEDE